VEGEWRREEGERSGEGAERRNRTHSFSDVGKLVLAKGEPDKDVRSLPIQRSRKYLFFWKFFVFSDFFPIFISRFRRNWWKKWLPPN
jgi:hypothetical protein